MSPADHWPVPDSPVARAIAYLTDRLPGLPAGGIGIETRPADHHGLHVRVLRTGGDGRADWPLVAHRLTFDVSHEDALEAEHAADTLHSLIDQWPWTADDVYREPARDPATAVWNPLDDPRVPAYTLTIRVALAAG